MKYIIALIFGLSLLGCSNRQKEEIQVDLKPITITYVTYDDGRNFKYNISYYFDFQNGICYVGAAYNLLIPVEHDVCVKVYQNYIEPQCGNKCRAK